LARAGRLLMPRLGRLAMHPATHSLAHRARTLCVHTHPAHVPYAPACMQASGQASREEETVLLFGRAMGMGVKPSLAQMGEASTPSKGKYSLQVRGRV
jgi:hypothetical protein